MEVVPHDPLGADIRGVDLARGLTDAQVESVHAAWLDHPVLFFRDQPLTPEAFLRFARCFGKPIPYPFVAGIDGYPEIIEVKKLEHESVNFGGIWHSDTTYLPEPPKASMLLAREVPTGVGDTLFADMYRAHDALPQETRAWLEGRYAVNSSAKEAVSRTRIDRLAGASAPEHTAVHPVVRTHPETGRKALFVNVAHTIRFCGLSEEDSASQLEALFEHQVQPAFVYRFSWRPGSIALWDNRCTQHLPLNDYPGRRRVMLRITLAGDRPR